MTATQGYEQIECTAPPPDGLVRPLQVSGGQKNQRQPNSDVLWRGATKISAHPGDLNGLSGTSGQVAATVAMYHPPLPAPASHGQERAAPLCGQ